MSRRTRHDAGPIRGSRLFGARARWILGRIVPALGLLVASAASAHDVWLGVPTAATVDSLVPVRLFQGHGGSSEPLARNDRRIETLTARGPGGVEMSLPGRHGSDPAGFFRPDRPGLWTVTYQSRPAEHVTPASVFENHLRQEGLDAVLEARRRAGMSTADGQELYTRRLRALVPVGEAAAGQDAPTGVDAELVLESFEDGHARLRLFLHGEPVPGALVDLHAVRPPPGSTVESRRTGPDGRVSFPLDDPRGDRVATAVLTRPAEPDASLETGVAWRTYFVATTFMVTTFPLAASAEP